MSWLMVRPRRLSLRTSALKGECLAVDLRRELGSRDPRLGIDELKHLAGPGAVLAAPIHGVELGAEGVEFDGGRSHPGGAGAIVGAEVAEGDAVGPGVG